MSAIPGLSLVPDYLDEQRQGAVLATVDAQPWTGTLKRRVQHYGYRYDYTRRTVERDLYLGPLPDWAADLAERLRADGHAPHALDQLIVNEYQPGQGISFRAPAASP